MLAISHLLVLPSAFGYGVGTLIFENYAAQYPARMCPYQCFACSLATDHAHDSGPVWVAGPSPYGSFIRTSTPVYPGAHPNISSIRTSTMITNSNSLCREWDAQSCGRCLLHTMSGTELSRVRTELGLLAPEPINQSLLESRWAGIVMQSSGFHRGTQKAPLHPIASGLRTGKSENRAIPTFE